MPTPYPVGDVNAYLLVGNPSILVDCGVYGEASLEVLREGISASGIEPRELGAILLTHHHQDHSGAAFFLSREWGVPVYASRRTFDFMRTNPFRHPVPVEFLGRLGIPRQFLDAWRSRPNTDRYARPDIEPAGRCVLGNGVELGERRLKVIETPGHSPDHVAYVLDDEQVLLSGDHVLPTITPNPLLYFDPTDGFRRCRSLQDYLRSLESMAFLADYMVLPGHGEPMRDAHDALQHARDFTSVRSHAYLELVRELRSCSVYELTQAHFSDRGPDQLYLCISETLGHLDLLEEQGVAVVDWAGAPVTVRSAGLPT